MIWILMAIFEQRGTATFQVEFNSKPACMAAATTLKNQLDKKYYGVVLICTEKGKP